ncbi:MAG: hypothetical protein Q9187_006852 [Circinaria calcarea]
MPKAKAVASLSGLIDSEMEDEIQHSDVDMMPTPESNQENAEPAKKGRGKAKAPATKVRKTKPASRRLSGGPATARSKAAAAKKKPTVKRAPLKEQINEERNDDTEDADEFQNEMQAVPQNQEDGADANGSDAPAQEKKPAAKKGRPAKKGKQPVKKPDVEQVKATEKDGEFEYTPTTARQSRTTVKSSVVIKDSSNTRQESSQEPEVARGEIPETQEIPMEVDQLDSPEVGEEDEDAIPQSVYRRSNHARAPSKQPQPTLARKGGGSASDAEKGGNDANTRRKLGEMTKKFESLEVKYRQLREVGIKEAEANFEKLKKQSEDRTKIANDLISSLKKELSTQKALAAESRTLRQQLITTTTSLDTALAQITTLTSSLSASQSENKVLAAKLAAARSTSTIEGIHHAQGAGSRTPGSTLKAPIKGGSLLQAGRAEAAEAAQTAQLKEDLYSDLTGLILRSVTHSSTPSPCTIYDCIQTGRNGTLHFKLSVATDTVATNTSYEETEFQYTPCLDGSRDRDLLELLPDYLGEEITFSRANAGKFYGRVVEVLTRRRDVEAEIGGGDGGDEE